MADQRVCRADDRGERPVVLHQLDRAAVFVTLRKPEHDRRGRPPTGVDRLIRITDHEEIAIQFGKNIGKRRLIVTHVLVLIHHDVLKPFLPLLLHGRKVVQDIEGRPDDIIKHESEDLPLSPKVAVENLIRDIR